MKGCLVLIALLITSSALSQPQLRNNSIVKDSSGKIYPAEVWRGLLFMGYNLKTVDPADPNSEFLLYKLTDQELSEKLSKLPKPKESGYFKTGKKINDFNSKDIDGNKINLKELNGKIVVLNFWFINCPPCRMEIPELNKLVDSFATNENVVFISIALDAKSELKNFLKRMPFNYKVIDNGKYIVDQYKIKSFPTHVVVDKEGLVYFHSAGLSSQTVYWIKKSINDLLEDE